MVGNSVKLKEETLPLITVVIVSFNSADYLPRCLESLARQTLTDFELVVVDNGSMDGSLEGLNKRFPMLNLQVERLMSNTGFAAANNLGARLAQGKWLALLNPDAFPQPDWLEQLMDAAVKFPTGYFFASRQIQANRPDLLDGEGDVYHASGLAWRQNYGLPVYPVTTPREMFSACAAAALYHRQTFLEAGGFDESYFAYHEDVDLGFRLRLRGLRCLYIPQAVVHHIGSGSHRKDSDFAIYYGHRNLTWTFFKDMPGLLLWLFLPAHIFFSLLVVAWFSFTGHSNVIWRAKIDAIIGLGVILQKRRQIQMERCVSVIEIFRHLNGRLTARLFVLLLNRQLTQGKQ